MAFFNDIAASRFLLFATYTTGTYILGKFILGKLLGGEDWQVAEEGAEEEGEPDGEVDVLRSSDDGLFIPMQYPQRLPRTFYKQSDPEWQEFVKMSWDEDRKDAVRDELASKVAKDVGKHPQLRMKLGQNIGFSKYWLDVKYPDGPPPEYARKGLEITDDYIAWSTQVIPHAHYVQLHHMMWPRAVFNAVYNSMRMFSHLQLVKIKVALGLKLSPMDRSAQQSSAIIAKLQADGNESKESPRNSSSVPGSGSRGQARPNMPGMPFGINTTASSSRKVQPQGAEEGSIGVPLLGMPIPTDFLLAWMMFAQTLSRTWSQTRMDSVPRGCFFVFGQIEVMGTKGRCKVDVQAAYDPKAAKYSFVVAKVKHIWDLEQSPRGGI